MKSLHFIPRAKLKYSLLCPVPRAVHRSGLGLTRTRPDCIKLSKM